MLWIFFSLFFFPINPWFIFNEIPSVWVVQDWSREGDDLTSAPALLVKQCMWFLECWDTHCPLAGWSSAVQSYGSNCWAFLLLMQWPTLVGSNTGAEVLFLLQCCTCPGSREGGSFLSESSLLWRSIPGHCRVSSSKEAGIAKFCFWSYSITGKGFSAAAVPPSERASGLTAR